MADKVKIQFQTNADEVKKKVKDLEKSVDSVQKKQSITTGLQKMLNKGGEAIGGDAGEALSGLSQGVSALSGAINPAVLGLGALAGITKLLYETMNKAVEAGMQTANESEKLNARLSQMLGAQGIDSKPIVDSFQLQSANGVLSAEELTNMFVKMVPVLHGNAEEAQALVERLHDIQSATGISGESLASLISRVQEAGEVDQKTLKNLEKNNIPILHKLAEVYGVSADEVADAVKQDENSAKTFVNALLDITEAYSGTASALSATTEGAKATMEALKGIANKSASDAYNDIMREYYNTRAKFWEEKKNDKEYQEAIKEEGAMVAEVQLFKREVSEMWDDLTQSFAGGVMDAISILKDGKSLQTKSLARDTATVADAGELLGNESATLEQLKQYRQRLEEVYSRFANFIKENPDNGATPALEKQLNEIQSLFALYDNKITIKENKVAMAELEAQKAKDEAQDAKEEAENILNDTQREREQAKREREQQEAKQQEQQEVQRGYVNANGTAQERLDLAGFINFDELNNAIDLLHDRAMNGELDKEGLQKLNEYKSILDAHNKELDEATKEEERIRKENNDTLREEARTELTELDKMHKRNSLFREMDESEEYNTLFEKMERYGERLLNAGFNPDEAEKMMQDYLAKLDWENWVQNFQNNQETISNGGLNSIKEFKFDENKVNEKALRTQQAIEKLTGRTNDLIQAQTRVLQLQQAIAG